MAAIARRSFYDLLQEFLRRIGRGTSDTAWSSRGQEILNASYLEIAARYHHFELDVESTLSLTTSNFKVALPADCWAVRAVIATTSGGDYAGDLPLSEVEFNASLFDAVAGQPRRYARFAASLYFDRKPAATTTFALLYYKQPTAADFSVTPAYSALHRIWDDAILCAALARASAAIWEDPQRTMFWLSEAERFAQSNGQPALAVMPIAGDPARSTTGFTIGGKQG